MYNPYHNPCRELIGDIKTMKKRFLSALMAGALGICALTGCRKAPEASADSDVYHAKSSLEGEVGNIVAEEPDGNTAGMDGAKQDGSCDALVGTEENGIWICAEVPAVPQAVPTLTLRERDDWTAEKLRELLDSRDANVQDITGEYLAQMEKELSEMNEDDKPVEWLNFGDDSFMILSDGQKKASFRGNTSASYVDEILKKSCDAIYKKAPEMDAAGNDEGIPAKFSVSRMKDILLEKLAVLDIISHSTGLSSSFISLNSFFICARYSPVMSCTFASLLSSSSFSFLNLTEPHFMNWYLLLLTKRSEWHQNLGRLSSGMFSREERHGLRKMA